MTNIISYQEAKKALGRTPIHGDSIFDEEAGTRVWESQSKPKCHVCHKTAESTLEIGKRVSDWIFRECNSCDQPVCEECYDYIQVEDPTIGSVYENECTDCYGIRVS